MVLDTKEGDLNTFSLIRLLENHKENMLIEGLKISAEKIDKDFTKLKNEGLL